MNVRVITRMQKCVHNMSAFAYRSIPSDPAGVIV